MTPSGTHLPLKKTSQKNKLMCDIANAARKRLGAQEPKWCIFVLCVISKDAFQKGGDFEKI